MATVRLWGVWFNDAADLSDFLQLDAPSGLSHAPSMPGSVELLAGGRLRLSVAGPLSHQWHVQAQRVDQHARDWLEAHISRPVWVRDWLGYKVYGAYLSVDAPVAQGAPRFDLSVTVAELTQPSA